MATTPKIKIAGRSIGVAHEPYIIAEMSANHNGKIENAFKIIEAAKHSGADAVKIQTYRPDTITLNCDSEDFIIRGGLWDGRTLFELYEEAHMPWEWHAPIFEYANKQGITIFSSPFDTTAVDLLEDLNVPAYKIASFEAVDIPLIKYVASTRKPMIISTGMADALEIQEAINAAFEGGCKELAMLHCVSSYPAPAKDYNLRTISDMIKRFGLVTGLSDHTLDNTTAITSISMGSAIIEKHFTLNRNGGGPDDSFSVEPSEFTSLCKDTKTAWAALGRVTYDCQSSEQSNLKFRRSLYFIKNLKKGETITPNSVRSIRPGFGLPPNALNQVINKKTNCEIVAGTAVSWSNISE